MRELVTDLFLATGTSLILLSVGMLFMVFVVAVLTGNPYLGILMFLILPGLLIAGGATYWVGSRLLLWEKKGKAPQAGQQPD